ncbi:hypothetical protein D3C81_1901000 [compost metagenome]
MALNGIADTAAQNMRWQFAIVFAIDLDHAMARFDKTVDHAHQRCLAGAGCADDDSHVTCLNS